MRNRLELMLAGLLIAAGLTSFALYQWVFVDPTHPQDWQAAAAWTTERTGSNDLVRIEPFWYETGLVPLVPVGDRVNRIRNPLLEDLYQSDNVLIVSQSDRVEDALAALPFAAVPSEKQAFGTVTALKIPVAPGAFAWELYDELQTARVSRATGDKVTACDKWDARRKRWNCGKPSKWTYVGQEEREVGDDPRRCVWAHPLDRGRTLRIEADVPESRTIRVRDSFDLRAARKYQGGDVLVQIFVNDQLKIEDRVAGNDDDWQAHDIDVSDIDGPVKLRIEVDLLGSIKDRFLCVNAWAF